jgi:hypothetical protein
MQADCSLLTSSSVIALSKLFSLNDPRISQIMVKGDLIVAQDDGRIKTRSRAKQSMFPFHSPLPLLSVSTKLTTLDPDQYTIIPASVKIIKVLVEEMISASGARAASNAAAMAVAAAEFEDDGDDNWEDDDDVLDLSLGSTKADLMSFMEGGQRQRDDETQAYLTEFFMRAARENIGNFQEVYNNLTEEEKTKLNDLANAAGASQ